jgi:hypothetical protein
MKDKKMIKKKIMEDEDFIYCPRLGNSLSKLIDKHPDGIDDERIEKVLLMTTKELEATYQSALAKLRKAVKE